MPVRFYRTEAGGSPVLDWLRGLDKDDRRAIGLDLMRVQFGWPIGRPLVGSLKDGLWEVRSSLPSQRISAGDRIVTFNYDVSLECALISARRFGVKNGYGSSFVATWDEPDSEITVLKLHGSINWIGSVFGGIQGFSSFVNSLGDRPFVDNTESFLPTYPSRVLDTSFRGGGVANEAPTLILPTYEKKYSVSTSVGDEWGDFYKSLWAQAAESLESSDRIVMIGYSMPQADTRARALLLWADNKRAEILLCCGGSNETLGRDFETHGFWRVTSVGTFADFCSIAG